MCGPRLKKVGQCVLEVLIGNGFGTFKPPMTLTFDPVSPKSIGFLCYLGWMG